MKRLFMLRFPSFALASALVSVVVPMSHADMIPARHPQGTLHGFLELRSEGGVVVAAGDIYQNVRGDRVTSETVFHFKDGSVDDEVTVYAQRRDFQFISDHHIQKGPSFPHPVDALIEADGKITVRSEDKDGKEQVKTDHMNLPPDLSNGMIPIAVENRDGHSAPKTLSMIVLTPKPRLVKLVITPVGESDVSVVGAGRKAIHYQIKIDLGGIIGVIAPLVGKAPPDIEIWTIGGQATTFAKEVGPLYAEGPLMTIQLASPVWPKEQ
jgi:hypothetical protein